ncbi:hypothetical protein BWGOE3_22120 [Bacillus mycoides]|nr:hypothetical protein BWGOE3_22120 [Bacillus mycoides]
MFIFHKETKAKNNLKTKKTSDDFSEVFRFLV